MRRSFNAAVLLSAAVASASANGRPFATEAFASVQRIAKTFSIRSNGAIISSPLVNSAASPPGGGGDGASSSSSASPSTQLQKAPTLNGKTVFPTKALRAGLEGHKVAAVYAVLNSQYKRGAGEGWEQCEYVGVTRDLASALRSHASKRKADSLAHVRALSFAYPQRAAMEEFASRWRERVREAGGGGATTTGKDWEADLEDKGETSGAELSAAEIEKKALLEDLESEYFDDDDDDDDDDIDNSFDPSPKSNEKSNGEAIISPFSEGASPSTGDVKNLVFNRENVDKVLDEVRPYLISDGGNVAVQKVDEDTKNVYLVLEGACGSCSSSTVTMQMGIERVLKENFPDLNKVIEVLGAAGEAEKPTELTLEAVETELSRIRPAITAMGGVVRVVSIDPLGVVELSYRGSNKLKQGLELAILDVPFVKHVKFVS